MTAFLRRIAAPLFFVAVTGGILFAGWRVLLIDRAYRHMADAPQGQSLGPADAGVVIAEFMDYRCKPCRRLYPVMQEVLKKHPGVRLVFRHRPVYREQGVKEAEIALAAGLQGKFAVMNDLLMSREDPVQDSDIDGLCQKAGVDCGRLKADMDNAGVIQTLEYTETAARALNIDRDPAFVIGRTIYTTRYGMPAAADFDRLIAQAAAKG